MLDNRFLIGAIVIMVVIIANDILKKYTKYDLNKIDVGYYFKKIITYVKRISEIVVKRKFSKHDYIIRKSTGNNSLYLESYGENKATVMATLRQITGITYDHANWIINAAPTVFITNISDDEADLTKKALEFVGAKIQIK